MSIASASGQVNPAIPTTFSRPFTAPSNHAEPFGTPRNLRGQYTSDQDVSIREVFFPQTWAFAFQVGGPGGPIFATREAAARFARAKAAKLARVQTAKATTAH